VFELAFVHFSTLSNDLSSPSFLACPTDTALTPRTWGFEPGGFLSVQYRNNALSYLVGAHAETTLPQSILSADRNIVPDGTGAACSVGFRTAVQVVPRNSTTRSGWAGTNLHGQFGNVLTADGAVLELDANGFNALQRQASSDNGSEHYVLPR